MAIVVKLLVMSLLPVGGTGAQSAKPAIPPVIQQHTKKVCALTAEDYPRILTHTLGELTARQVRTQGAKIDLAGAAKHLSRMISLGLPAAELDRQLWKDISDHRRYQAGARKGAAVGTTLADEGRCLLAADQYVAYYLGRARLTYQRRLAGAGCKQASALKEAYQEHAAWLKAVGCKAKPAPGVRQPRPRIAPEPLV